MSAEVEIIECDEEQLFWVKNFWYTGIQYQYTFNPPNWDFIDRELIPLSEP